MKQLIINADDFGLTSGVNKAVMRAHREGILSSATLMAGGLAWQEAVELARGTPTLGVGVHLTLTALKPVLPHTQVPSLVDKQGRFRKQFWRVPFLKRSQVASEWRAQIQRLLDAGLRPTHLDSHHHLHLWPALLDIAMILSQEFSIPAVRVISPLSFQLMEVPDLQRRIAVKSWRRSEKYPLAGPATVTALEVAGETLEKFCVYLTKLGPGVHELYSHPGSPGDEELEVISSLTDKRVQELELLCLPEMREALRAVGVTLNNYRIFDEERVQ